MKKLVFDNAKEWVRYVSQSRGGHECPILNHAVSLYADTFPALVKNSLGIAHILLSLGLDEDSLAASFIYPILQANEIHLDTIAENFGENIARLLNDAMQMQSLDKLKNVQLSNQHQIEKLRKMLLAMITDVRAVLIILAEQLWQLETAKNKSPQEQQHLAQQALEIYAPLANRLGIWQLKWELEDLSLRYLQPEMYKKIAHWLILRRREREDYIHQVIEILNELLIKSHIQDFKVTGRVKHIYSIYKKMLRKDNLFNKIYDISAFRVLVQNVDDCYRVLSILQNIWPSIQEEFDDYIMNPKPNGYRSIHTVMIGPQQRIIEIQIRTYEMHHDSELGIAAHWRYKEGILQPSNYEEKIALLREIMEWQKEVSSNNDKQVKKPMQDLFADRIYVFTPLADIIDLPKGATPLDFAYHIHSDVGHRCRGAKVNGHIVPLTYHLQTGERIEILTAKEANPSRDWLNPHYGYLNSQRARAKLQHWFRVQDAVQNQETPREPVKQTYVPPPAVLPSPSKIPVAATNIKILGISNLLTHMARCCNPEPTDTIIGYITQTRGISIHRINCPNLLHIKDANRARLIEVEWSKITKPVNR